MHVVKRIVRGAMVFALVIGMLSNIPCDIYAETLTNELIENSEKQKQATEDEKADLKKGLSNVQSMLKDLEIAKGNLEEYITELDADLAEINDNIDRIVAEIAEKEQQIATTALMLEEAQKTQDEQYEMMKKRIRFMYEKNTDTSLEVLLSASSFSDFLNRAEFINKVEKYDREMLNQYIAAKEAVAEVKAQLEQEQKELEEKKAEYDNEQNAMETLISSKEEEISVFEADIDNKEAAIAAYQAEIAERDQIIKDLEATIQAEKKRLLEENRQTIKYDGGKFAWPAPSYTRISDDYGDRMHPTLGVKKFHNGLDMAAPGGSPILAAYDGEVIAAAYSSSMGNYIMIDHGDDIYTIYMHASSLGVSKGQTVVRGERIGSVGSTGRSTGNHLHFSVRQNGNYTSPWNYLSK